MERKMNNRDRAEAYFMRLEGSTYQEIADKFGVTKQHVQHILTGVCERSPRRGLDTVVFPSIRNYMEEKELTFAALSRLCGLRVGTIINGLCGITDMTKKTIDVILDATGMTYEQAFYKESKE